MSAVGTKRPSRAEAHASPPSTDSDEPDNIRQCLSDDSLAVPEAPCAELASPPTLIESTLELIAKVLSADIEDILSAALDVGDTYDLRRHRLIINSNIDRLRESSRFFAIVPRIINIIREGDFLPLQHDMLVAAEATTIVVGRTHIEIAALRSECRAIAEQCASMRTDAIASQQTMADLSAQCAAIRTGAIASQHTMADLSAVATQAVVTQVTASSQALSLQLGKVAQQLQQPEVPPAPSAAANPAFSRTKTFASVVGSGSATQPQTRSSPSLIPASRRMAADRVSGQEYRRCFTVLVGSSSAAPMSAHAASVRAEEMGSFLAGCLGTRVDAVLDAYPLSSKAQLSNGPAGPRRYFIRVATLADAEAIVANRHKLKDSGTVVFDELSPQERSVHGLLWPTFLAARKLGLTAQFQRARLVVTKVQADGSKSKFSICP
jgi:hypothetical protein